MKKILKYSPLVLSFLPLTASAATTVVQLIEDFRFLINLIIGLLFGIALLVFVWGVVRFIASAGDEKARTEGKNFMTWGIIGLVIMASVWGLTGAIISYFKIGGMDSTITIPRVPTQ